MQIALISILNGWLAGLILLFLFSPVSGASTFCDGIMGAGTWREVDRRLSATAQEDFTIDKLKEAIQVYVTFESRTSTQGGAPGLDRVRGQKWRELAHAAEAINLSKDELEQMVADEIVRQAGERAESSRVVTEESVRRADQVRIQRARISIDVSQVIMHRIEPGEFMMGEVNLDTNGNLDTSKQVEAEIAEPFYLSATPTTQIIWKKVAELANLQIGYEYRIKVYPSHFKGTTRPVETVSWDNIRFWIDNLNRLSEDGEPALSEFIPDHQKGDFYRLPTEAEWEFVVRGRGRSNTVYYFGNDRLALPDNAWFGENSGGKTHPVGERDFLVFEGLVFLDMLGNVREWVKDLGYDSNYREGYFSKRIIRGGSWLYTAPQLRSAFRSNEWADKGFSDVGFRLARSARNP
ncbi:MAG: hypothetical protein COT74_12635 [Bdellovibrionales bacterium CG10_big_fil_rev_8_21_14_0_10_45_34]|nr:MAG: hypothetical protein COT74_12635 [Bdellovibrionales bacterium CG10_big_fil_rev_8_21_14_0_10_45_34]